MLSLLQQTTNCDSCRREKNCLSCHCVQNCLGIDDMRTDLSEEVSTSTNVVDIASSHVNSLSEEQFTLVPQFESAVNDSVLATCKRGEQSKDNVTDEASSTTAQHQSMSAHLIESLQERTSLCHSDCSKQRVSEGVECNLHRRSNSDPCAVLNTFLGTQKSSHLASGKVLPTAGIVMTVTQNLTLCKDQESTVAQYENQLCSVKRAYSVPLEIVDEFVDEDILSQKAGILMTSNCVEPVFVSEVTENGKVVKEEEVCTGM